MDDHSTMDDHADSANLTNQIRQSLEILQLAGVTSLPKVRIIAPEKPAQSAAQSVPAAQPVPAATASAPATDRPTEKTATPVSPAPKEPAQSTPRPATQTTGAVTASLSVDAESHESVPANCSAEEKANLLSALNEQVKACTLCSELAERRTQTVFGVGNPDARLCFLGEAPGADEDRLGEPFVGKAGQLQDKIINALGLERKDVYILNILRCRPPGNRNPTPQEATNCKPFYQRQLEIVDPEFIVCLGAVAATNLLNTTLSVGRLRGTFHSYGRAKVLATYHPSYLLRNPAAKKYVWDDMKLLLKEMGLEVPQR